MRETALYGRIRPKLAAWGSVDRVENAIGSGMWDIHYCFNGHHGWVETKLNHDGELKFERFQLVWARQQLRAGSKSLFLLFGEHSSSEMYVVRAEDLCAAPFTTRGKWIVVQVSDLVATLKMSKPYDWDSLRSVLSLEPIS